MNNQILVIVPHSSIKRPKEIKKEWLSEHQPHFLFTETAETDRFSDKLYSFQGIKQLHFPFSQVYINVCRDPEMIDEICPVTIGGKNIYVGEMSEEFRKELIRRYAYPFYKKISDFKGKLILNGHTTIAGHSSLKDGKLPHQIVVSNIVTANGKTRTNCPNEIIEVYVAQLQKRLPECSIGINSIYEDVHSYLCDAFGWKEESGGIPMIHQETDESLFIDNNKLNNKRLHRLRKAFAQALEETEKTIV